MIPKLLMAVTMMLFCASLTLAQDTVNVASVLNDASIVTSAGDTVSLLGVTPHDGHDSRLAECIRIGVSRAPLVLVSDTSAVDPSFGARPRYVYLSDGTLLNLWILEQRCGRVDEGEQHSKHDEFMRVARASELRRKNLVDPDPAGFTTTPRSTQSSTSPSSSATTSVQCSGTTKKGKRCSRMTTSANGRCYQH